MNPIAAGSKRYSEQLKKDAVDMVAQLVAEWAAIGKTADLLGVRSAETVRLWVRKVPAAGSQGSAAAAPAESELVRKLKQENAPAREGPRGPPVPGHRSESFVGC